MKTTLGLKTFVLTGLTLLCIALASAVVLRSGHLPGASVAKTPFDAGAESFSALRFVPETYVFGESPLFSGEKITFDAAIENASASPVVLTAIPKTCGCMTFGDEEGLKLPVTLAPGGRFPFHVAIATDGKAGMQRMQLIARGTTPEGTAVESGTLEVNGRVWTSIFALPDEINLEVRQDEVGSPLVRSIVLADEWPGAGLRMPSVTSTAGDRLRVSLRPADGKIMVRGLDLRKRHELTISYSVPPGSMFFDETITIAPTATGARLATVRLRGRVVPDAEVRPDRLVLHCREPGSTITRVLEYRRNRAGLGWAISG